MSSSKPFLKHLLISLFVLGFLLFILYILHPFIYEILEILQEYFAQSGLFLEDIVLNIFYILLVTISVLISYITYLLITAKSRTDLQIKLATRWLALTREQFRRLYDYAPIPYVMLNKKAEIQEPNKAALRFFGVRPEEIEGKNIFSFYSKDKDHAEKLFEIYKRNKPINREEIEMITKSGKTKFALLSVYEMKNPAKSRRTGLATIFDVTEQKKLDLAKTQFVSLASHQLRTPLATIKWYTDMLLSGDIGELSIKQRDYVERLHSVGEEMLTLVSTLLNISRIEIGTLPINLKETNVQDLSESVINELSYLINKKSLRIERIYNDSLSNINSDPNLLRIVIQNIFSNAIKYTPDGGLITVLFEESRDSKKITITDTGLGIPKDDQEMIFTKLFRASNVQNVKSSAGLGLYLIKSIMESLGGFIDFVSEEGKGSAFTIKL